MSLIILLMLLLLLLFFLLGRPLQRSLRLRPFKSDRSEIRQECSSRKYDLAYFLVLFRVTADSRARPRGDSIMAKWTGPIHRGDSISGRVWMVMYRSTSAMFEGRSSMFACSRRLSHALSREQEARSVHCVRLVLLSFTAKIGVY